MGEYLLNSHDVFVHGAHVRQPGHVVLSSGQHTDVKIDMEKVIHFPLALQVITARTGDIVKSKGIEAVVPVPDGALTIARIARIPGIVPSSKPEGKRYEFLFDNQEKRFLAALGKIAIFEGVVTTGRTPAAMADILQELNPDAELHLIGLWRRGKVLPEHAELFTSESYLVGKEIPSWSVEECFDCPIPS
jgi:orotate phosphoribosyltransferase